MQTETLVGCPRCRAAVSPTAGYCRTCGHALPGTQPEITTTDPKARAALLPTRPSPTALISLLAVVFGILALTTPILVVRWAFFGPDDTVRGYFAALAERDADAAWERVHAMSVDRASQPALAGGALRHADYTPPSGFELREVRTDGDRATAQVHYEIAGTPYDEILTLRRLGGPDHTLRRWHIDNGVRELPVAVDGGPGMRAVDGGSAVTVVGVPVLLGRETVLAAFPGAYTVRLPDDPLVEAEPVTVNTGGQEGGLLTPRLRDSARQQIEQQVKTYLERCAQQREVAPDGCPFRYSSYYGDVVSISWKITRLPTLSYAVLPGQQVEVETSQPGVATATGRTTSTFSPTFSEAVDLSVRGVAAVGGSGVTFMATS
ncbi:zinc ribbon domain-containing protein [Actinomycetes bacterium KLBMP 9797]